jgi:nitroreductase
MDVYEAVRSRRAVRAFTDEPVSREVLERVLSAAAWAPSGSNIQPWHVYYVLTGGRLSSSRGAPASAWPQATPGTSGSTRCTRVLRNSPYGNLPRKNHFRERRFSSTNQYAVRQSSLRRLI